MTTVTNSLAVSHPLNLETVRPEMAKAGLRNREIDEFWRDVGRAVARARSIVGWTQDELAGEIAKVLGRERFDPAQVARWESGAGRDRPQFVLFAIQPLLWPLLTTLARLDDRNEVVTEIRRRSA